MQITTKQLVTRRDENAKSETALMYFDGMFATCSEFPAYSNDRCFCDFISGTQDIMMKPDWTEWQYQAPYVEWKVWPCRVGIDVDRQIVDVKYDFEEPPDKVLPALLEEGEDIEMLWTW